MSHTSSVRCRSLLVPAGAAVLLLSGHLTAVAQSPAAADSPESRKESREESEILIERMKWFQSGRTGPDGLVPADGRTRAIAEMRANIAKGLLQDSTNLVGGDFWTPIGPSPIYDGSIAYAGRVTSFAAHPTDPNVLYLGSAQGGVWKTTNSGLTWQPVTDSQDSLSIGSIALAPSNPNIVYVGTGEANWACDSYFGTGVLRSADGGATWILRGSSTFRGTSIARIVVHPTNPDILWAVNTAGTAGYPCLGGNATGTGVWKSTDGGINWTQQLVGDWGFGGHDLVISPSDPNRLYAGMALSGVWRTTDGGSNWVKLGAGLPGSDVQRVDLAIDPNSSNTVYALIGSLTNNLLLGAYRSLDVGNSWLPLSIPSGTCQYWGIDGLCSYAGTGYGSCWYNLVIEVAPDGGIWAGGLGVFRSADGGLTWSDACPSDMHVDQHAIAFASDGKTWVGNDGGAFVTPDDGGVWLNRNAGLSLAQFYPGAALHPSTERVNDFETPTVCIY